MNLLSIIITAAVFILFYCLAWLFDDFWHIDYDVNDVSIYFGKNEYYDTDMAYQDYLERNK